MCDVEKARPVELNIKKLVVIDDNPNSVVNRTAEFEKVNQFLRQPFMPRLRLDLCRALKEEIEKEIRNEASEGFLTKDI
jgi:hypothetical protein